MTKLTDTQLMVLSSAAVRDDGAAVSQPRFKASALKVSASLVARKLMREVRPKAGMPVWREDRHGRRIALVITKAGLAAVNAGDGQQEAKEQSNSLGSVSPAKSEQRKQVASGDHEGRDKSSAGGAPKVKEKARKEAMVGARAQSKRAAIIGMLSAKQGATLDALMSATGWLPHTTRAVLTGLRKKGFVLERVCSDGVSTYRITEQPAPVAA